MIRVTGRLICATEADAGVVQAMLPEHVRLSRAEPGCLSFEVVPSSDPLIWVLDESFADRAAFEAHQVRTLASAWFRATAHLKRDFQVTE
ncbi:MAG: antibiotic biosynthesis monooxygenase [Tabrizicola sp.]|nr:antibiotic biosynthesis monooxygenase [Tabrizicola sp.]